jgi:hypothetical protein
MKPIKVYRWAKRRLLTPFKRRPPSVHGDAKLPSEQIREWTEARIQLAAAEVRSYADDGLDALSSGVRAAGKSINRTARRLDEGDGRLSRFIEATEERLRAIEDEFSKVRTDYNAQLRNVERDFTGAKVDHDKQIRNVEERLEFIRAETMYELQASLYKVSSNSAEASSTVEPQIINKAKLASMSADGPRLNVGCGHIALEGYLNVDTRKLPGVDIVAEATALPLEEGSVQEIASSHLVEHFTANILQKVVLPYWFRMLRPGGILTTVAPDGEAMLAGVHEGIMTFDDFREVLFGGQDYDGDFHYNLITPESFSDVLSRTGFVSIEKEYTGKRNGKCFEFRISARKP